MKRQCRIFRSKALTGAFLLFGLMQMVFADSRSIEKPSSIAVSSAHPLATEAGITVLENGGNAFDAAVTVSAVLAVVEPYSSGIGGGGFWLLHRAADDFQVMIDGRERAPFAAHEKLYQDRQGDVIPRLSVDGAMAAGIPGEPAALVHIASNYGRLPLSETLKPAIRLARDGFKTDGYYAKMAGFRQSILASYAASSSIFLTGEAVPLPGHRVVQKDLSETLSTLAQQGKAGFYEGVVAKKLVDGVRKKGGIWTLKDLSAYQVVERQPIQFMYNDMKVTSAAPPSSGGVALAEMLNMLSGFPLGKLDKETEIHLVVEAMRRAYRDRADYLGDPDFEEIPVDMLVSENYAKGLQASIRDDRATPSSHLPGQVRTEEGFHTTHFSILDAEGNRVSATLSINYPFGSGFVVPGTGVLLNDEMDDFSAKPGVPNVYGLVGAAANAIEPGKRPLSSMSPTFVESEKGVAILGSPGGSRIITMVLHGILNLQKNSNPSEWVSQPRYHHQYLPDAIQYEEGALPATMIRSLEKKGHKLRQVDQYGNMQAIYWDKKTGKVRAASDPRGIGSSKVKPVSLLHRK